MSVKRQATTELNHENWDDEDPPEEGTGQFKAASREVLEKRVIRTAKRRNPISSESNKNVFSGFGGFNKTQKSSFDFLANLTKTSDTNGSTTTSVTNSTTSSISTSRPPSNSGSLFNNQTSSSSVSLFGAQTGTSNSLPSILTSPFGSSVKTSPSSLFSGIKSDSLSKETPFKNAPISSVSSEAIKPKTNNVFGVNVTSVNGSQTTSTVSTTFKMPFNSPNTASPTVRNSDMNPDKNKLHEENKMKYFSKVKGLNEAVIECVTKHVSETPLCVLTPIFEDYDKYLKEMSEEYQTQKNMIDNNTQTKTDDKSQPSAPVFSSSSKQDVKVSTPLEFTSSTPKPTKNDEKKTPFGTPAPASTQDTKINTHFPVNTSSPNNSTAKSVFGGLNTLSTPENKQPSFSFGIKSTDSNVSKPGIPFGTMASTTIATCSPPSNPITTGFSFGVKPTTNTTTPFSTTTTASGFSFGATPSTTSVTNSLFSTSTTLSGFSFGGPAISNSSPFATPTTSNSSTAPFSFGIGKPFSFSPNNVQPSSKETENNEDEDEEPPKVEYTPLKEENSLYEKKCKIFVKKDGNFVDKGVGTLYIKKIEGNAKHQLLVRANTNLGTILLNLVLGETIPTQRMGKNNVMIVCIPTPDAKPPPTPILIRVKTGEEADELLETLNKYKA